VRRVGRVVGDDGDAQYRKRDDKKEPENQVSVVNASVSKCATRGKYQGEMSRRKKLLGKVAKWRTA